MNSGVAESFLKLAIALRDHEKFSGTGPLPVEEEKLSQVPQILYDYFGSKPDPVWEEIVWLRENIARLKDEVAARGTGRVEHIISAFFRGTSSPPTANPSPSDSPSGTVTILPEI